MKWLAALVLLLAGCASLPPAGEVPALRLSPAALGRELVLQQRMTVTAAGRSEQLDVALEADADIVRVAVLAFGQTVARLEWDGRELRETRAPGFPAAVTGARVLGDLQLVHWPLAAIAQALPPGWTLKVEDGERVLRHGDVVAVRVRYPDAGTAELHNLVNGYRIRLDTWGGAS